MNNTENNKAYKFFCYAIYLSAAGISLLLTYKFMNELGKAAGMPFVFAAVGIVFDLFKSFSPALFVKVSGRCQITALLIAALSAGLIIISASASIFSLENGVDQILSESKANKATQLKIDLVSSELDSLKTLHAEQLAITHTTAAKGTMSLISQKTDELNKLIDLSATSPASDGNLLSMFSTEIVYIIAIGLELISVSMTLVLFHLNQEATPLNELKQDKANAPETPVFTGFAPETQSKTTQIQTQQPEIIFAAATTHEQILENMRVAIQSRAIEPKHRQIWDAFKGSIRQKEIKEYLQELANRNVLKRLDNGSYVLA
ncbi:hypothetical protein [Vibrio parahaemolyticus]|uniref:hypothetical protein n=1 Tax=Vibrio parahaemolyticus TaxID=670 RepID=UPI00111C9D10|nr:hypothetical protein [Vibrio parahaemolyticus]TOI49046.1 hypothetical protein CGI58_23210 [Vibrio parahaemolyticus]